MDESASVRGSPNNIPKTSLKLESHTMTRSCRNILLASLLLSFTCGCASFMHEMQAHRRGRLNRVSAPSFNPDFTRLDRPAKTGLVSLDRPEKPAEMSANCAEVTLARGQGPEN